MCSRVVWWLARSPSIQPGRVRFPAVELVAALAVGVDCRRVLIASTVDACTQAVIFSFSNLLFVFFSLATFCYFHLFRASLAVSAVVFHSTGPGSIPGRGARGCLGTRRRLSTDINCVDSRRLYPGSHFFHLTPICLWYFF